MYHTCALFSGGTVKCWGDNSDGQLGVGLSCLPRSVTPLPVSNLCGVIAIAAGDLHTCALRGDGTVACWGETPPGIADTTSPATIDLGDVPPCPTIVSSGRLEMFGSMPGLVPGLTGAVAIGVGGAVDCAVLTDGTVRCWGWIGGGALGDGSGQVANSGQMPYWTATPVTVSGIDDAVGVTVAGLSSCAVLRDGTARCWGQNESGELGDGTMTASGVPVNVNGLTGARAVTSNGPAGNAKCAACYGYACALLDDGTARCWGEDQNGELGNGTAALLATPAPVAVAGLAGATSLVAGSGHVFATLGDGTAAAWGANRCGELGDGTMTAATRPVRVASLEHVIAVSSGQCHACALLASGEVDCWGDNGSGQLGNGQSIGAGSTTPAPVQW